MSNDQIKRCSYCFGNLVGSGKVLCPYCRNENFLSGGGELLELLNKAHAERMNQNFYSAIKMYDDILVKEPDCVEALWFKLLTEYGILLEKNGDDTYIPTLNRLSKESILEHPLYQKVLSIAKSDEAESYKKFAAQIEEIRIKALDKFKSQKDFDIFICFKKSKPDGSGDTADVKTATNLYVTYEKLGYNVFFSEQTLRNFGGRDYEPIIFHALSTAKVMILLGDKTEYVNAPWVVNEWSRYLQIIRQDKRKAIIPVFGSDVDYNLLSKELSAIQSVSLLDLDDNIQAIFSQFQNESSRKAKHIETKQYKKLEQVDRVIEKRQRAGGPGGGAVSASEELKLKQVRQFIDADNFKQAEKIIDNILAENNKCSEAWIQKARIISLQSMNKKQFGLVEYKLLKNLEEEGKEISDAPTFYTNDAADCIDKAIECMPQDQLPVFIQDAIDSAKMYCAYKVAAKLFAWADNDSSIISREQADDLRDYFLKVVIGDEGIDNNTVILHTFIHNIKNYIKYTPKINEEIFECVLLGVPADDVKTYIYCNRVYANFLWRYDHFETSKKYYEKVLAVDGGNIDAKLKLLLCQQKATYKKIFSTFYNLLFNQGQENSDVVKAAINQDTHLMSDIIGLVIESLCGKDCKKANKMLIELIDYIPSEQNGFYVSTLENAAYNLIACGAKKEAQVYLDLLLKDNPKSHISYLGKTLIEAKTADLSALILSKKNLLSIDSFNNAMNCSESASDICMKLLSWQESFKKAHKTYKDSLIKGRLSHEDLLMFDEEGLIEAVKNGLKPGVSRSGKGAVVAKGTLKVTLKVLKWTFLGVFFVMGIAFAAIKGFFEGLFGKDK